MNTIDSAQNYRRQLYLFLLILVAIASGCNKKPLWTKMRAKLEAAQLVEPPAPSPKLFDLVCDATAGSTCTKVTLEATLKELLHAAAAAPGSRLRLWSLGATVGTTKVMGEVTTPAVTSRSRRGREAQLAEWQSTSRDKLLLTMERVFAGPPARRSPIAESISKVALAEGHALTRTMVVITDAREVATANFECAKVLPAKEAWTTALHRAGVLTPGLLSGMTVALIYVTGDANGRCPVTLERQVKMFELWHYALGIAEARWIMTSDLPSFYPELKVAVGEKEKK